MTSISNNAIFQIGYTGIFLQNSNSNNLAGNTVYNVGTGTSNLIGSADSIYSISSATDSFGNGIFVDPSYNNSIFANHIITIVIMEYMPLSTVLK